MRGSLGSHTGRSDTQADQQLQQWGTQRYGTDLKLGVTTPTFRTQETPGAQTAGGRTDGSRFSCYNCGSPDHSFYQCTSPKRCVKCGSDKHLRSRCDGSGPGSGASGDNAEVDQNQPPGGKGPATGAGGGSTGHATGGAPQYIPKASAGGKALPAVPRT